MILVGTDDGLVELDGDTHLRGHRVSHLARDVNGWWAILDEQTILHLDDDQSSTFEWQAPRCILPTSRGLFVGGAEAHLWRNGERLASFDAVDGRDSWYTPWGGPPDVRSITESLDGALHANVHVGGIPRSRDGGETWEPTIDIDADVHQVLADPRDPALVLAAAAVGLCVSRDGGDSYRYLTAGLLSSYARAVALGGDTVLVTASTGPHGDGAAVYRAPVSLDRPFEKCDAGLPEWFGHNIDTGCLAANGDAVAFGTGEGDVFVSGNAGSKWERAATGLAAVRAVAIG